VNLESVARLLLGAGVALLLAGLVFLLASRLGLTRLPGDLKWKGDRVTVYFPLGLSLLASVLLTILLNLFLRR
jgi:hypothetical protein